MTRACRGGCSVIDVPCGPDIVTSDSSHPIGDAKFVRGGGKAGAVIRTIDWRDTPLGPAVRWPQCLRTALSICLRSRFPIALYWGSQFVMLYNDALFPMVGANKHPWAMGRPAFEVLPEIRHLIEPLFAEVIATGEAIWQEDTMLPLDRGDGPQEGYFTFTYSPIEDESAGVGGVFCAVLETTEKVIEERRLRLLNTLAKTHEARSPTMRDALEYNGYTVVVARDGREALARLPEIAHVCLVLLDLVMPNMNGWELLDHLRAMPELAETAVIVQSSVSAQAPAGVARVLTKPIGFTKLLSVVREFCAA
jgi:CheY-like chemotaxis protein